ncbi:hypothetical protein K503DRAFT_584485 [Rhizopogon vinicolor AM-OR11-026]|uniref:Uncharacterized protein n=1 Tax=Rhizopogon vinicolor AM-OR11-026 TaxID=1314800 RepID=A0A1B7MJG6_9AGAM|nr:hypothetical protein K503DRAFT_584485 [Rhizopogon vinicolor AM-OR11-026]
MSYPLLGSRQAICSAYTLTIHAAVLPRANPTRLTGIAVELSHQLILHHPTQTMRFSFLLIIAALTASMSVSACNEFADPCKEDGDCCSGLYCYVNLGGCA